MTLAKNVCRNERLLIKFARIEAIGVLGLVCDILRKFFVHFNEMLYGNNDVCLLLTRRLRDGEGSHFFIKNFICHQIDFKNSKQFRVFIVRNSRFNLKVKFVGERD